VLLLETNARWQNPSLPEQSMRGRWPAKHHVRPTDRENNMPPKPEPNEEPPVDAPAWTPDVREPDPDLLPDELPLPNPDENRDPPKRALQ